MRASTRFKNAAARLIGHLLAAALVLPPLVWLAFTAARVASSATLPDAISLSLLGRSVTLAGCAAALAVLLGVPYGWMSARFRIPGGPLFERAAILPLLLPPYAASFAGGLLLSREGWLNSTLLALGWIRQPLEPFRSFWLAAWVLAAAYWPIIAWFTRAAARSSPLDLERSARLHLSTARAAWWVARPALARSAGAGVLLVFLLCLADFGVPNSLGLATYPVELVNRFQLDRDPGPVILMALPLLGIIIPLVWLQVRQLDRVPLAPAGQGEVERHGSSTAGGAAAVWCGLVLAGTSLLPLGVLAAYAAPPNTFAGVWAESSGHFANTLLSAGGGALLATAVALLHGWLSGGRTPAALDLALTLPYALPASLVGVAMIGLLNRPGPLGELYTSMGGLVWTYGALFFPFAYKSVQPGWRRLDPELLDEGRVLGAGSWMLFRIVAWPVVRPYLLIGIALVALLAAREMDATALLRIPGGDTLAFRIHDYLHFAPTPKVAALCLMVASLSGAVAALTARLLPK